MSELADENGVVEQPEAAAPENVVEENATEAAPAAPEAPALDPLELQAELDHMRSQYTDLVSYLEQAQGQQQAPQAAAAASSPDFFDEYGNFDPAKFAIWQEQRDSGLLSKVGEMFTPLQQTFAQQQESAVIAEGEQRLADILADDISRNGEFASDEQADAKARELVATLASQMFPDLAERYGPTPKTAEIAMTRAATEVRSLLRSVGGAAVSQNQNQLATLAGAHGEPGVHGAGVEAPVIRIGDTSASRFAAGAQN